MKKAKRPYEKPVLKGIKVFEAVAQACCRDPGCATTVKQGLGKSKPNVTS